MGDPNAPALVSELILRELDRCLVDYVIVGGFAATIYGASRMTTDLDVVARWTDSNRERLATALKNMGAKLRVDGMEEPVSFPLNSGSVGSFELSTWRTDHGDLDVIIGIPTHAKGVLRNFEALLEHANEVEAFGLTVFVAGLDDIIESKQATGRGTDLQALPELIELRDQATRDGGTSS